MPPAAVAGLLLAAGASALRLDFTRDIANDIHTQSSFDDALRDVLARGDETCDLCAGPHWLFVVGTDLSGSTRVMNTINSLPGFYMAGENMGLFEKLSQSYIDMEKYGFESKAQGPFAHRQMSRQALFCSMQELTKAFIGAYNAPPGTHTIGFKEIRWSADVLNLTSQVFPCAKYIVNTKKQDLVLHALKLKLGIESDPLPEKTETLEAWQEKHANKAILLKKHLFGSDHFNGLLRFLGVSGCSFRTVQRIADDDLEATFRDVLSLDGQCVPPEQPSTTKQPVAAEQPAATQQPVAAEQPATTEQPAAV